MAGAEADTNWKGVEMRWTLVPFLIALSLMVAFLIGVLAQRGELDALVGLFGTKVQVADGQTSQFLVGTEVPSFRAIPLGSGPLGSSAPIFEREDLVGEPLVLVNFFASWCAPCLVEHPLLTRLSSRVPVYGVAWRDEPADTRAWLATHGNPYHGVSLDPESTIGLEFGVYGVPETFFIDQQGRIRFRHAGPLTPDFLERVLETHFPELVPEFSPEPTSGAPTRGALTSGTP